jgi:3-ketosteroid 9alpha-monooxygenase subunit A
LRRWYEQFYIDVEEIPADMVARHEYEIDTSRAVEAWEAEVAANLAAHHAAAAGPLEERQPVASESGSARQ